ncbi:MAG: TetR/AcrR family transcriptional regulator [Candidatus Sericytochromatia bacterium]
MAKVGERGRPRGFDKEIALHKALDVFVSKGYEATSLDDLTEAMGINRPSLYAAFGNKEALFLQALEAYACPQDARMRALLFSEPDTHRALAALFTGVAEQHALQEAEGRPMGCLVANSTVLSCGEQQALSAKLKQMHDRHEAMLHERLELGRSSGDLPPETDTLALARFFNGLLAGMGVLARAQQNPDALRSIASVAIAALPEKP